MFFAPNHDKNNAMIVIKFIFLVLGVIFMLGLAGGLVLVIAMYRLRKKMEQAYHNAQQNPHQDRSSENPPDEDFSGLENEFDMIQCPHCGTFTPAADPFCEHCGGKL